MTKAKIIELIEDNDFNPRYEFVDFESFKDDSKNSSLELLTYKDIDIKEIHEYFDLESYNTNNGFPIDLGEVLKRQESAIDLEEFRKIFLSFKTKLVIDSDKNTKEQRNHRYLRISQAAYEDLLDN